MISTQTAARIWERNLSLGQISSDWQSPQADGFAPNSNFVIQPYGNHQKYIILQRNQPSHTDLFDRGTGLPYSGVCSDSTRSAGDDLLVARDKGYIAYRSELHLYLRYSPGQRH